MKGLIDALRALGADIRCPGEEGHFPLEIHARGLRGGRVDLDASESSQMLSALLMVAPLASADVEIALAARVREPFVQMTAGLMGRFGPVVAFEAGAQGRVRVGRGRYAAPRTFAIEPDATAASYFAALPLATGGTVDLTGLLPGSESLQGDIRFLDVLAGCGLCVRSGPSTGGAPNGLAVSFERGSQARGCTTDFSGFSDTFLTLAALAPLLRGPTRISGIAHTRKQETDRVGTAARELRQRGLVNYVVVSRRDSLYRIVRAGEQMALL